MLEAVDLVVQRRFAVPVTNAPARLESIPAPEGPPAVDLTPEAGAILVRLARAVVTATASRDRVDPAVERVLPAARPAELVVPFGAFVTLHQDGALRGCIGSLDVDRPLWANVVTAAIGAASRDPRFWPVTPAELASLSIDVSVLGRAVPLLDAATFGPGVDGVIVERGGRRGLLLPEVATDQGWGAREMLEGTCWKAGLPSDAWCDPRTSVLVFRTIRFSEAGTSPRPDAAGP